MKLLGTKFSVQHDRMAIVGYADTMPVDSNATEDGRARNRRVDIVIVSPAGMSAEPVPVAQPNAPTTAPATIAPPTTGKEPQKGTRGHA
jgi:hypothetical protein